MRFRYAVIFCGLVFVVHLISLYFDLYWRIRTLDVYMHLLGGFAAGLLALAGIKSTVLQIRPWQKVVFVIGFVAAVGVIWEFLEFGVDRLQLVRPEIWETMTLVDTLADLMNDMLGAIISYIFFKNK